MSRRIESIPRAHRGLRRVDVDLCEFVGLIGVHKRRKRRRSRISRRQRKVVADRTEAGGELRHVRNISYNI
jgi:hypothetical protein